MSNIYVVGQTGHDNVKVGMTTRSVEKRIGDWDTGSPFEWVIHMDLQVEPKGILPGVEAAIHRALKSHRVRNEWFNADVKVVCAAIADAVTEMGASRLVLHRATSWYEQLWQAESQHISSSFIRTHAADKAALETD